ncbi:MAG: CRISPR-associated protein Cas4 [Methanobacteriaceae archaeon]
MENKLINDKINYEFEYHDTIKGIQVINGKNNFPISWLNQQGYCEYSLYLQYVKSVDVKPTIAMVEGTNEHEYLEEKFKETATPESFSNIIKLSTEEKQISREVFVIAPEFGIRGFIDEIWFTPNEFVIIDDKPGTIQYHSTVNQVLAYCLAFREMIDNDPRPIKAALRERGTDNIFFIEEFDENHENSIKYLINRMHGLFSFDKPFLNTKNKNKCNKCRFRSYCSNNK